MSECVCGNPTTVEAVVSNILEGWDRHVERQLSPTVWYRMAVCEVCWKWFERDNLRDGPWNSRSWVLKTSQDQVRYWNRAEQATEEFILGADLP